MAEVNITRKEIILVGEVGENSYGDLTWTDAEGKGYKVSNKRKQYFENIIVHGAAVQLSYAEAYGKEYVYSATQVKDSLPPPKQPQPHPTSQVPAQDMPQPKEITGQTIGMTTKEIGDMIRAKELTIIFGRDAAVGLIKWYRSQILGNTRIQYDGAKLPQFEKGGITGEVNKC